MAGLALGKRTDPRDRARRWILLISLGTNLGLLAFFKSANFVMGAFGNVVEVAGLQPAIPTLSLMLLMHGWRLLEERRLVAVPGGYAKAAPTGVFLFFILTAYGPTNAFIYSSSSRDRHLAHLASMPARAPRRVSTVASAANDATTVASRTWACP